MKILKILSMVALVLGFTSCGVTTKSSLYPVDKADLKLKNMDKFELLGESEISSEYDTYLGCIRRLNTVNGELYIPGEKVKVKIPSNKPSLFRKKGMEIAAAKLLEKYPEARLFQVVSEEKNTDVLFLGSTTMLKAKIQVYKYK